jgi:hypothetical protein
MVADLSGLTRRDLAPPGLRIVRVESEPELREFARVLAGNWTPSDPQMLRFYELASLVLFGDSPLWLYVGYLGDVPVGTAELTVGGDSGFVQHFHSSGQPGAGFRNRPHAATAA